MLSEIIKTKPHIIVIIDPVAYRKLATRENIPKLLDVCRLGGWLASWYPLRYYAPMKAQPVFSYIYDMPINKRSTSMRQQAIYSLTILVMITTVLLSATACDFRSHRPDKWATRLYNYHFRNAYRVSDKLYRSAQPGLAAYREFYKLGVRVSINLRGLAFDPAKLKAIGIRQVNIPVSAANLNLDQVIAILKVIKEADSPVLVQCEWGADRSGAVTAFYRIVFQGWSKDEAIDEMVNGGFGFHKRYQNLITLIRNADIGLIKRRLDLAAAADKVGDNDLRQSMRRQPA
jgi:tyrosine-protein phosphatase SIW14